MNILDIKKYCIIHSKRKIAKYILPIILAASTNISAQDLTLKGKVTTADHNCIEQVVVDAYFNNDKTACSDTTYTNQEFTITKTTTGITNRLPEHIAQEFVLSNNYPNPFTKNTHINLTVNEFEDVDIKAYNTLGQEVAHITNTQLEKGTYKIPLTLKNLPSGVYIIQAKNKDKTTTQKIVKINGTQEEIIGTNIEKITQEILPPSIKKNSSITTLDSIVIHGTNILKKTYNIQQEINTTPYNIGELQVCKNTIPIIGKIYNLFNWKDNKNNQVEHATIKIGNDSTTTDVQGKYNIIAHITCEEDTLPIRITKDGYWTRTTGLLANAQEDTVKHNFGILDTLDFNSADMKFYEKMIRTDAVGYYTGTRRWNIDPQTMQGQPKTYIEQTDQALIDQQKECVQHIADSSKTPWYPEGALNNMQITTGINAPKWGTPEIAGYTTIVWDPQGPASMTEVNYTTKAIKYTKIMYSYKTLSEYRQSVSLHELLTIFVDGNRFTDLPSIMNIGHTQKGINDLTAWDVKALLFEYSRAPGNKYPDNDKIDLEQYNPNR